MWEFFTSIGALSVFLGIAAIGFLFLVVSLVFGEIFDHLDFGGDHDFDHDLDHGPGFFSVRVMSVFITAFGGFGAVATQRGYDIFASSFFGFAGGVVLAGAIYGFARFLYSQQASSTVSSADFVGRTAQVSVGIPDHGTGQVRCLIGETVVDKMARSRDGRAIPYNSLVKIEDIAGESVIVAPVHSE